MMRRFSILLLAAFTLALAYGPLPAAAQNILGLSIRPTELMPSGTGRGSADIIATEDGGYLVSVDLSNAAEALDLNDWPGATAWVVWIVDMDGVRHNIGTLDDNLVLEDARVDTLVAKIFITAEPWANTTTPSENRLFEATLRDVEETDQVAEMAESETTTAEGEQAAGEAEEATAAGAEEATTAGAEEATAAGAEEEAPAGPEELPTTGGLVHDLAVLALVAAALLFVGLRLRTVRI